MQLSVLLTKLPFLSAQALLKVGLGAALLVGAAAAQAQAGHEAMLSYAQSYAQLGTETGAQLAPALAWCDSPDRLLALGQLQQKQEGESGLATLREWPKVGGILGTPQSEQVQVGRPEAGAGQLYRSLNVVAGRRQGQSGYWHSSNIENARSNAYRMTHTGPVKLGGAMYYCRYVPQAEVLAATNKRTLIIWHAGDKVTYATRNYGGGGVYVTGGKLERRGGARQYSFPTPDGYRYEVTLDTKEGKLQVYKGQQLLQTEPFVAYSLSVHQ